MDRLFVELILAISFIAIAVSLGLFFSTLLGVL